MKKENIVNFSLMKSDYEEKKQLRKKRIDYFCNNSIPALLMVFMAFANGSILWFFAVLSYVSSFNKLVLLWFLLSLVNVMYYTIFSLMFLEKKKK